MMLCEEVELHTHQFAVPFCGLSNLGEPRDIRDRFQESADRSSIGPKFIRNRHRHSWLDPIAFTSVNSSSGSVTQPHLIRRDDPDNRDHDQTDIPVTGRTITNVRVRLCEKKITMIK